MPKATSISRPVRQRLQEQGFTGRVLSVHRVVCNLIDDDREVITLLAPSVPAGPFTITIDVSFDELAVGVPAHVDTTQLVVGDLRVTLDSAATWEPRPDWPRLRMAREPIATGFAAFDEWTSSAIWGGLTHITGADQHAEGKPLSSLPSL